VPAIAPPLHGQWLRRLMLMLLPAALTEHEQRCLQPNQVSVAACVVIELMDHQALAQLNAPLTAATGCLRQRASLIVSGRRGSHIDLGSGLQQEHC
jgi:hypothetical protein